jgi:SAM-dependent methyltransferase
LLLPPNINYIGIDFVKRSDKTIICDFNKFEFPDVRDADIVFVMGCYEWVRDGRWLLRKSAGALKAGGQFFTTSFYGNYVKEFTGYKRNWCYFMFPYELILYLKELGLELVDGRDCNLEHQILKFIKRGGDSK